MEENMEIDKKELVIQMEDEILKGNHTKLEIIIGEGSKDPLCSLENKGATNKEIGLLYVALDGVKEMLETNYPIAVLYAKECLTRIGRAEINMDD